MWKLAWMTAVVIACGKSGSSEPKQGAPATGPATTWKGTWTRTEPVPGGGAMTLVVPANAPGTVTADGSACITANTPIHVAIDGANVTMDISAGDTTASYTGTIAGNEMSGTMTVSCKVGTGKGTFKLTKQ
jgi:hypothetical protein